MDTRSQALVQPNYRPETILEIFRRTGFDLCLIGSFQRAFREMLFDPRLPSGSPTKTHATYKAFGIREFVVRDLTISSNPAWNRLKIDTVEGIYFPAERIFLMLKKRGKWTIDRKFCFSKKVRERFFASGVLFETEVPPVSVYIIEYSTDEIGIELTRLAIRRLGEEFYLGPTSVLYPVDPQETFLPGLLLSSGPVPSQDPEQLPAIESNEEGFNGRLRFRFKRDSGSKPEN